MASTEIVNVLDSISPETLRDVLLFDNPDTLSVTTELQNINELAKKLRDIDDFDLQTQFDNVVRTIKSLSDVVIKYITRSATKVNKEGKVVVLDDHLQPIFNVLNAFVIRLRRRELQNDKDLVRWLPFVVTACYFIDKREFSSVDLIQSLKIAEETLDEAVKLTKAEDRTCLIAKYASQIVALCSQDVKKEEWVAEASINKKIMLQLVEEIPFPYLGGDLLGRLLALTFPLVDDLIDSTQLIGARMLRHIVHNVTLTELRWYSDVLLEVLHTALVSRKPQTLDVLLDCLVESLDKVSAAGNVQHYDRFIPRLLRDTSLCTDVSIRVVFVRHLQVLIVRQGAPHSLNAIRYLQPLLKVLIAGFESVNVTFLVTTLEALQATVLATWPRIASHTEQILVGVLRAVAFCEIFDDCAEFTPSNDEKAQILALCEDVVDLLHKVNAGNLAVSNMLIKVGNQVPKLSPFCNRMQKKWKSG
ncbi:Armadillo-type fold [Plasmopara halstedii]|uniref:Armadillo-type fold n=1 Tax=Plasmopara halstedii TaxID=4781 RepID=A0A0P1A588_PLAHL|nr:Armadillo-type fold [Plasmopara halstedii]CEG35285.1 Armadillo-type fold [Plasmopara halstedii]|eukprot:XP_024571654.1 Armadillo-type fold [Plasmopara halstedii]